MWFRYFLGFAVTITIDVDAIEVFPDIFHIQRFQKAAHLIDTASYWSLAVGLIPVPFLDAAALATIQSKLLMNLSGLYGEKVKKELASSVISVVLGTLIPLGVTKSAIGLTAKFLPGAGSIIGSISMATMGATATKVIGKVFVRHFENGGTLTRLSESTLKAELREEFMKAKYKV